MAPAITVGIADMKVAARREGILITHALGSCLGVALYDPVAGVGGMLHVMLPLSAVDPRRAQEKPCMFVDTGVPRLFEAAFRLGARKERTVIKVAGGSSILDAQQHFKIGQRNYAALRKLLWKNDLLIEAEDVGGEHARTMSLALDTGAVAIQSNGALKVL